MNEMTLRRAVYALDLRPNTKFTLLGIMCFVNWEAWSGPCSAKDISKAMHMHESSVRRALKDLVALHLIRRTAKKRSSAKGKVMHHRAETQINVTLVMSRSKIDSSDDSLTPSHSATHTIKDIQQRITTEVTIDSHSSEPDQESKAEEGEVLVDEGEYSEHVIDYARGTGYTPERAKEIMNNIQRKLELRRQREKSGKHNRPTTAYNPKPY